MSRILRRPMFRKGGLSSEDTGIVSGLGYRHRQGYAGGADSQGVQQISPVNLSAQDIENYYSNQLPVSKQPLTVDQIIQSISQAKKENEAAANKIATEGPSFNAVDPNVALSQDINTLTKNLAYTKNPNYEKALVSQAGNINQKLIEKENERRLLTGEKPLSNIVSEPKQPITVEDLKNIFKEPSLKENLKESLNALQELGYGPDKDALARQRYLELAKFGFNLASQPTPVGYKANLLNSIARAAEPSVSGLQKIDEQQIAEQQALKNSALGLAVKQQFPADRQSAYLKTLLQLGKPLDQAIQLATTGEYRNIASEQGQIDRDKQTILQSKVVKDQGAADSIARDIASFRARGIDIKPSSIKPIDPTKLAQNIGIENQPYYTPNNDLVIYKNGKYRRANEVGQVNSLYGQ